MDSANCIFISSRDFTTRFIVSEEVKWLNWHLTIDSMMLIIITIQVFVRAKKVLDLKTKQLLYLV